jgi:hypothetical protein
MEGSRDFALPYAVTRDQFKRIADTQESRLSDVVGVRGDGKVSWREQANVNFPIHPKNRD